MFPATWLEPQALLCWEATKFNPSHAPHRVADTGRASVSSWIDIVTTNNKFPLSPVSPHQGTTAVVLSRWSLSMRGREARALRLTATEPSHTATHTRLGTFSSGRDMSDADTYEPSLK